MGGGNSNSSATLSALADAAATSLGNKVQTHKDIAKAIDIGKNMEGIQGIVIISGKQIERQNRLPASLYRPWIVFVVVQPKHRGKKQLPGKIKVCAAPGGLESLYQTINVSKHRIAGPASNSPGRCVCLPLLR